MPGIGRLDILDTISLFVALIVALTVHEASHAWMAVRLGDDTPRRLGRLTLNPLAHLDPLGTIMMVFTVISGFGLGWAKPVPINPYRLRPGPHTGMAIASLAGPASNLLAATFAAASLGILIGLDRRGFVDLGDLGIYDSLISVNVVIAIFNLIPVPPLDGFHVLLGVLPRSLAVPLSRLEQYGPFLLLLLIFVGLRFLRSILVFFGSPILESLSLLIRLVATFVAGL